MIYFRSDYSLGAHPEVMQALVDTNMEQTDGYGMDPHCEHAGELVKELIGTENCSVHMMIGGTNCNVTLISAALKPYEAVVAARSSHIYCHETGAVEACGHKIITFAGENGKLTPSMIDRAWEEYEDEHTVVPRLAFLSLATEIGSVYSKAELEKISEKCRERNMLLYIDGARLGYALTSACCDFSIRDLPGLCDAFYIGGTKNGALFGEALVILNPQIDDHFRWMIKQKCGMLAKGRLIGVQFEALLAGGEASLYYRLASGTNRISSRLRKGLEETGFTFLSRSDTNQLFPVLPAELVHHLEKKFFFLEWAHEKDGMIPVRFVCSWGTTEEDADALVAEIKTFMADNSMIE